jgi:hypothetical protein
MPIFLLILEQSCENVKINIPQQTQGENVLPSKLGRSSASHFTAFLASRRARNQSPVVILFYNKSSACLPAALAGGSDSETMNPYQFIHGIKFQSIKPNTPRDSPSQSGSHCALCSSIKLSPEY